MDTAIVEILEKLIAIIEKTAPELWRIVLKQVFAETYSMIFKSILFIIIAFIGFAICKKIWNAIENEEDTVMVIFIGILIVIIPLVFAIGNINAAIMRLANPEYYAIQLLLTQFK